MSQPIASRVYVDTSALAKLLVAEAESDALEGWLRAHRPLVTSTVLLQTELHRVALALQQPRTAVEGLLQRVDLIRLSDSILTHAERVPAAPGRTLGALDAIHLASAQHDALITLLTYDSQLTDAARYHGIEVVAPR